MADKTYTLRGDYPLRHDGEQKEPGDTVVMDEKAARPLVDAGRLKPAAKADAGKGKEGK